MKLSFKGGIRLPYKKNTAGHPVEDMPPLKKVYIPLLQHTEDACVPLVKEGDIVDKGQKIGEAKGELSCPVHVSVSGVVKSVEVVSMSDGEKSGRIVIANDFEERLSNQITPINRSL